MRRDEETTERDANCKRIVYTVQCTYMYDEIPIYIQ